MFIYTNLSLCEVLNALFTQFSMCKVNNKFASLSSIIRFAIFARFLNTECKW